MAEQQKSSGITDAAASKAAQVATKQVATQVSTAVGTAIGGPVGTAIGRIAGSVVGDVSSRIGVFVNKNKYKLGGIAGAAIAAPFYLLASAVAVFATGLLALGSAVITALIAIPLAVIFIFFIISNSALVVPSSYGVVTPIDDTIIANPDCPVLDGVLLFNNPMWGSYQSEALGHGSAGYWNWVGGSCNSYPLPQVTNCRAPMGRTCPGGGQSCPYYGFSLDAHNPISNIVVLPRIGQNNVVWDRTGGWVRGPGNITNIFTDSSGRYTLVLTHMDREVSGTGMQSGTQIGRVGVSGGSPHIHIEFQVDGVWVRPENYFCRE